MDVEVDVHVAPLFLSLALSPSLFFFSLSLTLSLSLSLSLALSLSGNSEAGVVRRVVLCTGVHSYVDCDRGGPVCGRGVGRAVVQEMNPVLGVFYERGTPVLDFEYYTRQGRHADLCVDVELDVHVAPLFRAEANLLKALVNTPPPVFDTLPSVFDTLPSMFDTLFSVLDTLPYVFDTLPAVFCTLPLVFDTLYPGCNAPQLTWACKRCTWRRFSAPRPTCSRLWCFPCWKRVLLCWAHFHTRFSFVGHTSTRVGHARRCAQHAFRCFRHALPI